jgi:hypothetical protein
MVFRFVAPKFLRPSFFKKKVRERFVVPEDSVVIGIEHSIKASENIIGDTGVINSMVLSIRCSVGVGIIKKTGDDGRRATFSGTEEGVEDTEPV